MVGYLVLHTGWTILIAPVATQTHKAAPVVLARLLRVDFRHEVVTCQRPPTSNTLFSLAQVEPVRRTCLSCVAQTALVAAVDLRTYLLVLPRTDQKVCVDMRLIGISLEWTREELIQLSECNAGWLVKCGAGENTIATSLVCISVIGYIVFQSLCFSSLSLSISLYLPLPLSLLPC